MISYGMTSEIELLLTCGTPFLTHTRQDFDNQLGVCLEGKVLASFSGIN